MKRSKKLLKFGDSRGIVIPMKWLRVQEAALGKPVEVVALEMTPNAVIMTAKGGNNNEDSKADC